jgi:hypothetical protein
LETSKHYSLTGGKEKDDSIAAVTVTLVEKKQKLF